MGQDRHRASKLRRDDTNGKQQTEGPTRARCRDPPQETIQQSGEISGGEAHPEETSTKPHTPAQWTRMKE